MCRMNCAAAFYWHVFRSACEYPITGVSATKLPLAIGTYTGTKHAVLNMIESHNVFAHVWAGAGVVCFSALATSVGAMLSAATVEQT